MKELLKKVAIAGAGTLLVGGFALAAVGNDHTGYDSENNATVENENRAEVESHNDVHVDNDVDGTAKTGENRSSYNTGSGHADSGDAEANISATSKVNDSSLSVSLAGTNGGIMSVTNSTTGAESENNAWIKSENSLELEVDNHADVDNDVNIWASTGHNSSSYNTGNGGVSSGDASLTVSLSNTANSSDVSVH